MLIEAIGVLLTSSWKVLTSVKFPATEISIASILVGAFLCVLSLKIVGYMMQFNFHGVGRQMQGIVKQNDKINGRK